MSQGVKRAHRVSEVLLPALANILQRESDSLASSKMVTVTAVDISDDLRFAKVFISTLDEEDGPDIVKSLNNATKTVRFLLAKAVKLRVVPNLLFVFDDSIVRGNRIASLVKDVSSE